MVHLPTQGQPHSQAYGPPALAGPQPAAANGPPKPVPQLRQPPAELKPRDQSHVQPNKRLSTPPISQAMANKTQAVPQRPTPQPASPPPDISKLKSRLDYLDLGAGLLTIALHAGSPEQVHHAAEKFAHDAKTVLGDSFGAGALEGMAEELGHLMGEIRKTVHDPKKAAILAGAALLIAGAHAIPPLGAIVDAVFIGMAAGNGLKGLCASIKLQTAGQSYASGQAYGKAALSAMLCAVGCLELKEGLHAARGAGHAHLLGPTQRALKGAAVETALASRCSKTLAQVAEKAEKTKVALNRAVEKSGETLHKVESRVATGNAAQQGQHREDESHHPPASHSKPAAHH